MHSYRRDEYGNHLFWRHSITRGYDVPYGRGWVEICDASIEGVNFYELWGGWLLRSRHDL